MKTEKYNCGLLSCEKVNAKSQENKFVLQPLPYAENALAPYISEKTVQYHYGKHLATYIDNTNKLKAGTPFESLPLHEIIRKSSGGLFNNAAQVFNHYFYFETLHQPGDETPHAKTLEAINRTFGNLTVFKEQFAQAGTSLFGSGWVWLVKDGDKLEIVPTPNAETPIKDARD
ncbi:MAG: superoxide dismutase, partial [Odoribacter sp.]|nr:superoxide dismutase [Odoribacter sp.]